MKRKEILIIDNDPVITRLMETFLLQKGHKVQGAQDAFEALDILKHYKPDIIFLDRIMPIISGDKLCQIIREIPHAVQCYIVIISATLAEAPLDLEKIGADSAIVKGPFADMSKFITEAILESNSKISAQPTIKGLDDYTPRYITQELFSQNQYLQKLLETISQGVLELENNRVLYANQSAINMLKIKREILLGSYLNEMLEIKLWDTLGPRISTCRDISIKEDENSPVKIFNRQIIIQCIKIDKHKNRRLVLLNDITERKRMEAIVEATNLTENLGFIFSGIRHEIGNPVNSIKMALTVLQKNLDNYDKQTIAEFTSSSLEEVARLEYLLKALKNYSLFENPLVQKIPIADFMESFLSLITNDLENNGIEVKTSFENGKTEALTDSRALHHVLLNLITNAVDAVSEAEKPHISLSFGRGPGGINIQIKDNGCGIPEEDLKNIFTPFFTSKPQGTGLGLAIVKKMLSGMKSTIEIESFPEIGTTATIILPEA